jgi:hypothetical protein
MQKVISLTTAAEFCQALEDWIIDNKCNPTTPEEWTKCIDDMTRGGALTPIACIDEKDAKEFKEKLKETLRVEEI